MPSVKHPPVKPTLYSTFRLPLGGTILGACGIGVWHFAAQVAAGLPPELAVAVPAPGAGALHGLAVASAGAFGIAGAAAWGREQAWRRATEDQRTFEAVARILGGKDKDLSEKARRDRMSVRARTGVVPRDVRVRTEWPGVIERDERARKNLARAFSDATSAPLEQVRVAVVKHRAIRIWVEEPEPAHEPEPMPGTPDEPALPPVPAVPADDRTQERVAAAMRGALNDKAVQVRITDTHDDRAPSEVWIEYPPALTARILDSLESVRDTMERVHHARNDEWTVRWVSARDRIILTDRIDPLARIVDLPDVHAQVDLHKGVPVGITESGAPWLIPLMGGNHTLVAGASGSGKGSVLWNVLRGVAPLVRDGRARVWLIDPKGGMELGPAEHVAHGFAVTPDDADQMLERVRGLLQSKADRLRREGRRKIEVPTVDEPLDLVVVDELANATTLGGPAGKKVGDHIAALCSMGRAPAVTVIGAVQDPRKETFKHRGLFTHAVALRMSEANETNLILGQGARAQGAIADMIPKAHPGIGYVIRDGQAGYDRARAAFVSDDEIEATVRRMERPLPAPPLGDPIAAAAQDELPDDRTITTRPDPRASNQPRPREEEGRRVRIVALNNLPVRAYFDSDPDPVTITAWENSPEEEDRIIVTYRYDDGPERDTDVEDTETVRLAA